MQSLTALFPRFTRKAREFVTEHHFHPRADGLSAYLRFPRFDEPTFEVLDKWLCDHPNCRVLMVDHLPEDVKEVRRLNQLAAKHDLPIQLMPKGCLARREQRGR